MKKYDRLIFVSSSDTAVGPMAEAILQSKFLLEELEITSKGVVVLFPEPINPKAEAVLVSNGLTMKNHMSDPLVRSAGGDIQSIWRLAGRLWEVFCRAGSSDCEACSTIE